MIKPTIPLHRWSLALLGAFCLCMLTACAGKKAQAPAATIMDLDSLHREEVRQDSVESNVTFYEHAYDDYRRRFPGVDKADYMRIAKGKDQDFCLFKPDPARKCLEVGDKFNDLNLKDPARDAYQAGLVSEGANESRINVRLWASMGRLAFEHKDYEAANAYLGKVLEVEPKNKWAKKLMASIPK